VIGAPGSRQVLLSTHLADTTRLHHSPTPLAYTKGGARAGVAYAAAFSSGIPRQFDALSGFDFGRSRSDFRVRLRRVFATQRSA